ncbi:MAG: insulinase family protein [Alphaproteobacteria bacterium]|nr:insulinase family protein [Alphaproteobacteria bacterium]
MTLVRSLFAALGLLMLPASAHAAIYGAESFTLDNGMEVVVIPNHRAPVVAHMVWYRVGAVDEPPGKSGIAHFLEHLMFKGTPTHPAGEINQVVARNGGDQNAFTSFEYTGYYQNIAVDRLPKMMELEADRMRNLILSEEDVATERDVIIEERRMRVDNRPGSILDERLSAALWMTHRYGTPVIGWPEEMAGLNREDALQFYKRFYAPENAILVISGDITAKTLKPLAEKYYGVIPRGGEKFVRPAPPKLMPGADVRVTYHDERVKQPSLYRRYVAPSYATGDQADVDALTVFAEIAGGGATSKLYRALVVDREIAASAGAGYDGSAASHGSMYLDVTPNPGIELAEAEKAMDEEMRKILGGGISDDDVAKAKQRMKTSLIFLKDSPLGAAQRVGAWVATGLPLADLENWDKRLETITADRVRSAAKALFASAPSATGILLPKETAP